MWGATREPGAGRAHGAPHAEGDLKVLFAAVGAVGSAFIPFFVLLLQERGLAADRIGVVLSATSLAGVAAAAAWSHAADARIGSVRALQLASIATAVLAVAMMPTGSNVLTIGAVAMALGAAQGSITPLGDSIALSHLGDRISEYGSIRLWSSVGWAVAVMLVGLLYQRMGLGPLLPVYALGMIGLAAWATRFEADRPDRSMHPPSPLGSVGRAFRSVPRLTPYLLGLLLVWTANQAAWSFVPLRIVARGGGPFLVGLAAGVAALIEVPFMRSSAALSRRFGLRWLFAAGCAVYVAMLVGWAVFPDPVAVAAIRAASGVGFGLTYVATVVMTGRLVPPHLRATGQALAQTFSMGLGPVLGAAAGGFVYRHVGAPQLFAGAAVVVAVGIVVVWVAARDVGRRSPVRSDGEGAAPDGQSLA